MPYAKRPTTPVSMQEAEGALVVGYWLACRPPTDDEFICEKHASLFQMLDNQENQRAEIEKTVQEETKKLEVYNRKTDHFQQRRRLVIEGLNRQPQVVIPESQPIPTEEFKFGLLPLTNGNTVTPQPPLPMAVDLAEPYRPKPGTIEAALEMAKLPPVEGAKVTFSCPSCGKEVSTGEVHSC